MVPLMAHNRSAGERGFMEGRRHKRAEVQVGCWIARPDGELCCCSTFDISETGISLVASPPLPVGRVVSLQFYTPHSASALSISAEVVWSCIEHNGSMGLRFLDITAEKLKILKEMTHQTRHRELIADRLNGRR